jgi:hypothetical protein
MRSARAHISVLMHLGDFRARRCHLPAPVSTPSWLAYAVHSEPIRSIT